MPRLGADQAERDQFVRFHERMAEFKEARDFLGRRAFALPVAHASQDARWLGLERITMAEWLAAEGFDSVRLHWYVNYACRDDYGTDYRQDLGLGRHPLLRLPRRPGCQRGAGVRAYRAGGQRLDRQTPP